MRVPPGLRRDVEVVLARPAETLEAVGPLPGGTVYEPKWDGYRMVAAVDEDRVTLWSRRHTNLTGAFPDLAAAVAAQVPAGTVLDGEAVIWHDGRLNFDLLGRRLVHRPAAPGRRPAPRLAGEVADHPATFLVFDVLAVTGQDLRDRPWRERRTVLEELAGAWRPPLQPTPSTDDPGLAGQWFVDYRAAGVEGLVAKGAAGRYRGGRRDWVKVKSRETSELVVGAVTGTVARPETLILGGHDRAGRLRIVGRSVPLPPAAGRALAGLLDPAPGGSHPWPATIGSGLFGAAAHEQVRIVRVVPRLVVEVAADTGRHHGRFRHPVRFLRTRPDLDPTDLGPVDIPPRRRD